MKNRAKKWNINIKNVLKSKRRNIEISCKVWKER